MLHSARLRPMLPCSLLALVLAVAAPASAQPAIEQLLTGDPTPGTVALLVRHADRPEAHRRLGEALRHARPDVRAAAARVIYVIGAKGLVPDLASAIGTEREANPALEIARALAALGGPTHDEAIITSWSRIGAGAGRAAAAFARVRGPVALDALAHLRAADPAATSLTAFLVAARPEASVLLPIVRAAVDEADAQKVTAVLDAARELAIAVDDDALVAGLAPTRAPDVRLAVARHVLRRWTSQRPPAAAITTALGTDAPLGRTPEDFEARLIRELGRRASGAAPTTSRDWLSQFDAPPPGLIAVAMRPSTNRLLTDEERRRLQRAFPNLRVFDDGAAAARGDFSSPPPPRAEVLDGFPDGFVSGVVAATGCDPKRAARTGLGAGAGQLTRRADGRVSRVSRVGTGVIQAPCLLATDVLLMTHVARVPPGAEGAVDFGVLPFDPEYLACRDRQNQDAIAIGMSSTSRVDPPKKTRHVDPVYPPGAQQAGVSGLVVVKATIGTQGCAGHLEVLQSVDPRLDLAALIAVSGWRFTPTRIDGRPVPVELNVTVLFSAQ